MELAVPPEEGAVGGDAAEGDAGGGGADEVMLQVLAKLDGFDA